MPRRYCRTWSTVIVHEDVATSKDQHLRVWSDRKCRLCQIIMQLTLVNSHGISRTQGYNVRMDSIPMMTMGRGAVGSCVSSSSLVVNDRDHATFVWDDASFLVRRRSGTGRKTACARAGRFGSVRCHVFDIL